MGQPRKCIVCRKEYYYCPHCGHVDPTETWKNSFCSENCRSIFKICQDYVSNSIKPADAKKRIEELDTSRLDKFAKIIGANVVDILSYKPKTTRKKKKDVNDED